MPAWVRLGADDFIQVTSAVARDLVAGYPLMKFIDDNSPRNYIREVMEVLRDQAVQTGTSREDYIDLAGSEEKKTRSVLLAGNYKETWGPFDINSERKRRK